MDYAKWTWPAVNVCNVQLLQAIGFLSFLRLLFEFVLLGIYLEHAIIEIVVCTMNTLASTTNQQQYIYNSLRANIPLGPDRLSNMLQPPFEAQNYK